MKVTELPYPPHPTLPLILDTEGIQGLDWKSLLAIALLIALLYLIFYFLRAQKQKPELGYMKKMQKDFDILQKIYEIKKQTLATKTYLLGTLELSKTLREYIQSVNVYPKPITAMTVEELKTILESPSTRILLENLRDMQFSNTPITPEMFESAVKKTEEVVKQKYFASLKKR